MRRDRNRISSLVVVLAVVVVAGIAATVWLRGGSLYAHLTHPLYDETTIAKAAASENVDPYLVSAVINVESGFRANARSSAGAIGLMQVKPSTAKAVGKRLGLKDAMNATTLQDPVNNIRVGTSYLGELLNRYRGDPVLALAAYNAGISNADEWARGWHPGMGNSDSVKLITFPETVNYVGEVLAQVGTYRSLYPDVFPKAAK